jgi:hypothetical protein
MTASTSPTRAFADAPASDPVEGRFATLDDGRYALISHVDRLDPFLMSVVSDSDTWLFVGSNGPFTAGRGNPDVALFPYQTVDKILQHPLTSGARTSLLVRRGSRTSLWEPWLDEPAGPGIARSLYKRVDGTAVVFEETNRDLGLRFRSKLAACEGFGLVRDTELLEIAGEPVDVRYLDGFHHLLPPGVDVETYARLSYLAIAYMRHERLPGGTLATYSLNAAISDRPEPSESLRTAVAWSVGHATPVILLSDRQLSTFRDGGVVATETEVRGEMGAYLVADRVGLSPGGRHAWTTVGDTNLDHARVVDLRLLLEQPVRAESALVDALQADRAALRRRVAAADGVQVTVDEAATASHWASVLFNIMRGGAPDGPHVPTADFSTYLRQQNRDVAGRHRTWAAGLGGDLSIAQLRQAADTRDDAQLSRLARSYLPLTFSRRHGDPSRPWNRFSIRLRDESGSPLYGYEGNWRDIFQNWEALGRSYPTFLRQFVSVFLNASSADGYNPYRITRMGIDWEVQDPDDRWSHIGYWGDHQIVYLLRLLEAVQAHEPGVLAASLDERLYSYARIPYRIADIATVLADPRDTIVFDRSLHDELHATSASLGADAKLVHDARNEVRLVTLAEKLLVPLLVKLTNLVPGGGIWLNTQRPEWNDANNALAGWGLSVVTLSAIRRYLGFLAALVTDDRSLSMSASVARLLEQVTAVLETAVDPIDDAARYRILVELGRCRDRHRDAVYGGDFGDVVAVPAAAVRRLTMTAGVVVDATLRANRRPDGLYHSYNTLRIDGTAAAVQHLGPMLEGQVAILDSGLLGDAEAVELLDALRSSDMYRADQHSYLLYPDRALTPYLQRNTLNGSPPVDDPSLFVRDRTGAWHFQADLSAMSDVERRLDQLQVAPAQRSAVLELWRATFSHDEFTGRSGRFFMFEGLGSIYWHMVSKLLLAVQACHGRATDPTARQALAARYRDIRNGLGFRRTPRSYGAFPTDPYSHTPRHRGAQQPGMTGHVKEQVLARLGELGVEVASGRVRFRPSLIEASEFDTKGTTFSWTGTDGRELSADLPPNSLAFTYCGVPVVYTLGAHPAIEIEYADGTLEVVPGAELDRARAAALFDRSGTYRRLRVTVEPPHDLDDDADRDGWVPS